MHSVRGKIALWVGVCGFGLGVAAGCIPEDLGGGGSGVACNLSSDCVPNGCCGQGTGVVSADQAPSCGGVKCDGSCPVDSVNCGCDIPTCSENRCTLAHNPDGACGSSRSVPLPGQGP